MALPGITLAWDTAAEDATNVFVQYNVYKRESGTSAWTRVQVITSVGTTTWTDYLTAAGVTYEYAVTWTALVGGSAVVESDKQSPAASATTTFRNGYLHPIDTPGTYAELTEQSVSINEDLNMRFQRVWGREADTAHIGSKQAITGSLNAQDSWHDNRAMWDNVRLVVAAQRAGSSLCLRHRSEVYFVAVPGFSRSDRIPTMYSQGLQLVETHYSEAV